MRKALILLLICMATLLRAEVVPTETPQITVSAAQEQPAEAPKEKTNVWTWTWVGFWTVVAIVATSIAATSHHESLNR